MDQLKVASVCRMGAYSAWLAGFCYVLIVCCAFLSPPSIASYVASEQYFLDFKSYRPIFVGLKWLMLVANIAMVGVVCAFYQLRRRESHGLMSMMSALAIVGFGVGMYQSVQDLTVVPFLADQYAQASEMLRQVIIALGVANPAIYIVSMGLPGLWFIAVSIRAWSNPIIPRYLVVLGFMWGCGNMLTVIAHSLIIIPLIYLVAFGAVIMAPIWSIGEGLFLWKMSKKALSESGPELDQIH